MQKWMVILLFEMLAILSGGARTLYVAPEGTVLTPTPPFTNGWDNAATNIQNAVDNAVTGDLVLVSNGTYYATGIGTNITGRGDGTNMIYITNGIVLTSVSTNPATVINGSYSADGSNRCLYISHAQAVVSGFTITNGYAGNGGGVFGVNGVISNCIITGNTATNNGGGVYCDQSGSVTLSNCWITGNQALGKAYFTGGGGVFCDRAGKVKNCVITRNSTATTGNGQSGGGVLLSIGGLLTNRCLIYENTARYGGALYFQGSSGSGGTVVDCVVSNNTAHQGGCAYFYNPGGSLLNSEIVSNHATLLASSSGGGVYFTGGAGIGAGYVSNCIIQGNIANNIGGGLHFENGGTGVYCTVAGNMAGAKGGGVYMTTNGVLRNCLISDNQGGLGGGIYANNIMARAGVVESCTIAANSATNGGGIAVNETNRFVNGIVYFNTATNPAANDVYFQNETPVESNALNYCCASVLLPAENRNLTNAPLFRGLPDGNYRLTADSPCINAGTNETWMDTAMDSLGRPRKYYGRVDIGCYEYFLDVKVNGIPIDRVRRINGVDKSRVFRISE